MSKENIDEAIADAEFCYESSKRFQIKAGIDFGNELCVSAKVLGKLTDEIHRLRSELSDFKQAPISTSKQLLDDAVKTINENIDDFNKEIADTPVNTVYDIQIEDGFTVISTNLTRYDNERIITTTEELDQWLNKVRSE